MREEERQALAVAENLRSLARGYAERRQCAIALSLYRNALEWAKRAGKAEAASALTDQLLREQSALRQEQARQYDGGELTIPGGARK
jgi:hypothetical protein